MEVKSEPHQNALDASNAFNTFNTFTICIFIVCHDDASEEEAHKLSQTMYAGFSKIVRVSSSSKYFENQIFQYFASNRNEWDSFDYVGVCPYSWLKKTSVQINNIKQTIELDNGQTDVFSMLTLKFIKRKFNLEMSFIEAITHQHGPFMLHSMMAMLTSYGGYSPKQILSKKVQGFFMNHWIAKKSWMEKYVNFYITSKVLAESPALKEFMDEQSWYTGNLLTKPETLIRISGKPHYTIHPFLFERLPAIFFHVEGANVKNVGSIGTYIFND